MKIYLISCALAFAAFSSKVMATENITYILEHSTDGKSWTELDSLKSDSDIIEIFKAPDMLAKLSDLEENAILTISRREGVSSYVHTLKKNSPIISKDLNILKEIPLEETEETTNKLLPSNNLNSRLRLLIVKFETTEQRHLLNVKIFFKRWTRVLDDSSYFKQFFNYTRPKKYTYLKIEEEMITARLYDEKRLQ